MNTLQRFTVETIARAQPAAMDEWAIERVRAMGRTVLGAERAPKMDTCWTPTRGVASLRNVTHVFQDTATLQYRDDMGRGHTCAFSTWHRWVRRTRAVQS